MADQAKNILIGIFVIAAMTLVVFVLLFLHPSVGDEGQTLRVRFADIDKVTLGTRVTYGGKPVGEVIDIKEVDDPDVQLRVGENGFIYLYELTLQIDSSVRVYNTDEISLRTSGLLGERSVEIAPQVRLPEAPLYLVNDQILFANETGTIEDTLKDLKKVADKLSGTLTSVKDTFDNINQFKILEKIDQTAQNLSEITTALNDTQKWSEMLDNFHAISQRVNDSWGRLDEVIANANEAFIKFDNSFLNLQTITDQAKSGQGTFGRLFMRDDLYLQLNSLFNKGSSLFDDINAYGLMFQNNKQWQRLRARRVNLITKLRSPQEFQNYFSDEVNQINASLTRLNMVLEQTESCDCYEDFMEDAEFRKVFADLIRRVKAMEESLQLYNNQVVEREIRKTELCVE